MGVDLLRPLVAGRGLVEAARARERAPQTKSRIGRLRVELQSFLIGSDGLAGLARSFERVRQVELRPKIIRARGGESLQMRHRFGGPFLAQQQHAEVQAGLRQFRLLLDHLGILLDRLVVLIELAVGESEVEPDLDVFRVARQTFLQQRRGLRVILRFERLDGLREVVGRRYGEQSDEGKRPNHTVILTTQRSPP